MTDWKAGEGRSPESIEAELEAETSPAAVRRIAVFASAVTFSLAVLGAGYFAARPAPKPPPSVHYVPPPPPEPSTIQIDQAKSHSLPYRKFGPEQPREPTRALTQVKPRPKRRPKKKARRAPVQFEMPKAVSQPPVAETQEKAKMTMSKPLGGSSGGAVMGGGGGAALPASYEGEENAAAFAARDPAGYEAKEKAEAMRALKAVLMGDPKAQQILERDKPEIYEAEAAAESTLTQDHGTSSRTKKKTAGGIPKVVPTVNGLKLPQNMQNELERLGREYQKRKK